MIHFRAHTAAIFWETDGRQCRQFSSFAKILMRKLRMLDAAKQLSDLRVPPGNKLEGFKAIGKGNIQYASTINIAFVLFGLLKVQRMLKLWIITKQEKIRYEQ